MKSRSELLMENLRRPVKKKFPRKNIFRKNSKNKFLCERPEVTITPATISGEPEFSKQSFGVKEKTEKFT